MKFEKSFEVIWSEDPKRGHENHFKSDKLAKWFCDDLDNMLCKNSNVEGLPFQVNIMDNINSGTKVKMTIVVEINEQDQSLGDIIWDQNTIDQVLLSPNGY